MGEPNKLRIFKHILVAVILILLSLLMRYGIAYHDKKTAEKLNEIVTGFEESIDAITEMEDAFTNQKRFRRDMT